jgi:thiamine biosynthesis protein ThiI
MIRFGELNTKGKNKIMFINTLLRNIKHALKEFKNLEISKTHDRIYIDLNGEDHNKIHEKLQMVSGIQNYSFVNRVEKDMDKIIDACEELIKDKEKFTFKVKAKRADKNFNVHSDDMNRLVATRILKNYEHKVDIHNPDVSIYIEVRLEGAFVYLDIIKGLGGFPLGVIGKSMLLMSGGIDSPVAAYLMMKRGIKIEAVHFASPPYTSDGAIKKVKDLLKVLAGIQEEIKLVIIPFTKIQEKIYEGKDESYNITIMRRMMYRIAEREAIMNNCLALCSGESIGQVASQTLESMATINEVVKLPMIRPLAIFDKLDIIDIAKKIGTYDISIRPFIDCCTIFTPKNPTTKPSIKRAETLEKEFDYESLIEEAISNAEVVWINQNTIDEEIEDYL